LRRGVGGLVLDPFQVNKEEKLIYPLLKRIFSMAKKQMELKHSIK